MAGLDLIFENKNGQLEFDFNALEAVTNSEFVEAVKFELHREKTVFGVENNESFTQVTFVDRYIVTFLRFTKHSSHISYITVGMTGILDLSKHAKEMGWSAWLK